MMNLVEAKGLSTLQAANSLVGYRGSTRVKKSGINIMAAHYIPYLFLGYLTWNLFFQSNFSKQREKACSKNTPTIFKNTITVEICSILIKRNLNLNERVGLLWLPCMNKPFTIALKWRLLWSRTFWWAISMSIMLACYLSAFYYYYYSIVALVLQSFLWLWGV